MFESVSHSIHLLLHRIANDYYQIIDLPEINKQERKTKHIRWAKKGNFFFSGSLFKIFWSVQTGFCFIGTKIVWSLSCFGGGYLIQVYFIIMQWQQNDC